MKNLNEPQSRSTRDKLDDLCDAYNAGRLPIPELVRQAIPLLEKQRIQDICIIMCQLCVDNPGYYRRENQDDLWTDAERIYGARVDEFLLTHPKIRNQLVASMPAPKSNS